MKYYEIEYKMKPYSTYGFSHGYKLFFSPEKDLVGIMKDFKQSLVLNPNDSVVEILSLKEISKEKYDDKMLELGLLAAERSYLKAVNEAWKAVSK